MSGVKNVMGRRSRRGGVARSPLPDTEFVGQTYAHQIEKALRPLVKSIVSAVVLECKVVKVAEAAQDISVPTMLGVVELESAKIQGLLNIDTDLAYHLIDLMMGGDPDVAPIPVTRAFTGIDMALCGLAQDVLLDAFAEAVTTCFRRPLTRPLRIVDQRQDITQIRVAPEHADVLVYNIALDIGSAARSGSLRLLLPLALLDAMYSLLRDPVAKVALDEPKDLWRLTMRHAAARAPVVLEAVLHRRRMSVVEVMRLRVGDVLELPAAAVSEVQLTVAQPGGKHATVASGQLGAFEDAKVLRLLGPVDERVRESLRLLRATNGADADARETGRG